MVWICSGRIDEDTGKEEVRAEVDVVESWLGGGGLEGGNVLGGGSSGDVDANVAPLSDVEVGEDESAMEGRHEVLASASLARTCVAVPAIHFRLSMWTESG